MRADLELLKDRHQEQENLRSGQVLAQTVARPDRERNDLLRFHELAIIVDVSARVKLVRLRPDCRVVMNVPDVAEDLSELRKSVKCGMKSNPYEIQFIEAAFVCS